MRCSLRPETNVHARPPLPRSVVLENWNMDIFFLEDIISEDGNIIRLKELLQSPVACSLTVLHEWMRAAEPIPEDLLRKLLAHLLVVPFHCFTLVFDFAGGFVTVEFKPDQLTRSTLLMRHNYPHMRCFRCDVYLDPDHKHNVWPGDFGTESYCENEGWPTEVGWPGDFFLCCLCYHTAAYTRMLWHENIFLEDDPEEAYKNRIKSEWQPVASLESIACRWPDYHNHCVGKHPMLRSSEGLRLADDYCVMLKNWCCWHHLEIPVWKRADVRAWKRVSPDVCAG